MLLPFAKTVRRKRSGVIASVLPPQTATTCQEGLVHGTLCLDCSVIRDTLLPRESSLCNEQELDLKSSPGHPEPASGYLRQGQESVAGLGINIVGRLLLLLPVLSL